jgi:hypothetical protein
MKVGSGKRERATQGQVIENVGALKGAVELW